jgi:hypothetical protein
LWRSQQQQRSAGKRAQHVTTIHQTPPRTNDGGV